jgi:hypothetical protein
MGAYLCLLHLTTLFSKTKNHGEDTMLSQPNLDAAVYTSGHGDAERWPSMCANLSIGNGATLMLQDT